MWGNDFPHPEGTWPHTREWLKETFWDCPEEDTRRILGHNALEFYGFDAAGSYRWSTGSAPRRRTWARGSRSTCRNGTTWPRPVRPWLSGREAVPVPRTDSRIRACGSPRRASGRGALVS